MTIRPDSPPVEDDRVTELQESVLLLLEAAGIPEATCDAIMKLVEAAEIRLAGCPVCGREVCFGKPCGGTRRLDGDKGNNREAPPVIPSPWITRLMIWLHIWCYAESGEHCDKCGDSGR